MTEERLNWYLREFSNPAARTALDTVTRDSIYDSIMKACQRYKVDVPDWLDRINVNLRTNQVVKAFGTRLIYRPNA